MPGAALQTPLCFIHSFSHSVLVCENIFTAPHALMVEDGAFSHKIEILNPEGHPNCITGSKVTAILLNWWILPIGGASAVKGLRLQPAQQAWMTESTKFNL